MVKAENSLVLAGQIEDTPSFSHSTHDFTFMRFSLKIARLSGVFDRITVLIDSNLLSDNPQPGDYVEIEGELRSYNNKTGIGNKLVITAFAKSLKLIDKCNRNELYLCGTICKMPTYRKTPLGREICDLMIAINRRYGRADYLPLIAWGKNAQFASELSVGNDIHVSGRIQSREYIKSTDKEGVVRTTYEVSVTSIDLP